MYTKNELKDLWRKHGFRPRKKSGQNFLIDKNIKDKIISELHLTESDRVMEIGPGFGQLTLDLAAKAASVRAVEKDEKICEIFGKEIGKVPNLELIKGDVLETDLAGFYDGRRLVVVGNLPYYITTPILEYLIENRRIIKDIYITVQKEFADRIVAVPGSGRFSSLSVFLGFHTLPKALFNIKASCFFPQPEVDSQFLRLQVLEEPAVKVKDEGIFFRVVRLSFQHRRKTMLNCLSHKHILGLDKKAAEEALEKAGVNPSSRPQDVSIQSFARIADNISG